MLVKLPMLLNNKLRTGFKKLLLFMKNITGTDGTILYTKLYQLAVPLLLGVLI